MIGHSCMSCGSLLLLSLSLVVSVTNAQSITALTGCHIHDGGVQYCIPQPTGDEVVVTTVTNTASAAALPTSYSDCHSHGKEMYCVNAAGNDVGPIAVATTATTTTTTAKDSHESKTAEEGASENCHFHAGVEHCGSHSASSESSPTSCQRKARDYNVPIRIGAIFIVLATSTLSVAIPLFLARFRATSTFWVSQAIRQFGTGVIISTAFVHLWTHAQLMFANECVGELDYEATTSAVTMGGFLATWLVEVVGERVVDWRSSVIAARKNSVETSTNSSTTKDAQLASAQCQAVHDTNSSDTLSVAVMEAGIIFHSILIGITLVVAGDSVFSTLLVVIVFHQGFEGLALASRIAALPAASTSLSTKILMAAAFAIITPVGMAIGVGVRNSFNGSDRTTLLVLGTLDAVSAGVLLYVGVIEMLGRDWEELKKETISRTLWAGLWLAAGTILMGVLGKWA